MRVTYGNDKDEFELDVTERISLVDQGALVTLIVEDMFEDDVYYPYKYNYVFWYRVLHHYTNFDVTKKSVDELAEVLETTNICDVVQRAINPMQFENIEKSVNDLIQARLEKSEFDKLCADVRVLLAKYDAEASRLIKSKAFKQLMKNISKVNFADLNLGGLSALQNEGKDLKM